MFLDREAAVAFALLQGTAWTAVWRAGSREAITKSAMNLANRRTSRDRVSTIPTDRCAIAPARGCGGTVGDSATLTCR